jgi:tRNA modification GTPase
LADADLVLVVIDKTQPLSNEDRELLSQVRGRPAIVVGNKSDLARTKEDSLDGDGCHTRSGNTSPDGAQPDSPQQIATSAVTGEGISALRTAILEHIAGDSTAQVESGFLTSVRHQKLVNDALASLEAAAYAVEVRVPHEMLLLDLYGALRPLDEITGATTTDDILNLIFGTFCIGK